jgi:DNA-binding transcriptional MerR regulator
MTISEVSEKYDLTQDALRYYERIGLIPPVPRKSNGFRDYDEYSCGWIEFIRCMRNAGLPIESLIEYVKLYQEGTENYEACMHILMEERAKLDARIQAMIATRERLDCKIVHYAEINADMKNITKE